MEVSIIRAFPVLILMVFLFHHTGLSQAPVGENLRLIRVGLQAKIEKGEVASIAVGVIKDGKILWKETFGWADKDRRIEATSSTIYPIASVSKSITSTGLWLLVQRGKLSPGDSVKARLGSAELTYFQGRSGDLKIRHLLTMEGGIPHQFEYYYDQDHEERPSLAEQIRRYGFVAFPPGRLHHYSNFSMAILDAIIADVSGKSFPDFMKREVFEPLGMHNTFVERPPGMSVAKGYDSKGIPVMTNFFLPRGGAGLYSTLDDLLDYGLGHLSQSKLLSGKTLERSHRPNPRSPNPYYNSGWGVLPTSDGRVSLLSNGAIAGSATTVFLVPKDDLVIVCLTNTTVGNEFTDGIAFSIGGALLDGYSDSLGKLNEKVQPLFADKPFVADASYIGSWEGQIRTDQGKFPIKLIFRSNGETLVSFDDQGEVKLNSLHLESGLLKGTFAGNIPTKEAMRSPHQISLELFKEKNKLFGVATARSDDPKFYLPYYVELAKL